MYHNIKNDLIVQNSLSISLKNSLTYLLDNYRSLPPEQIIESLCSVINQIDTNYCSFNLVLDKIDLIESDLKVKN